MQIVGMPTLEVLKFLNQQNQISIAQKKSLSFHKDAWTWANCSGGYINTDGTWFYENQLWTGTEDEITWAITEKCGTRGVHTGGTKKEVLRALDNTVAFFKTHLK